MGKKSESPQVNSKKFISSPILLFILQYKSKLPTQYIKGCLFNDTRMKSWNAPIFLSDKMFKYHRKSGGAVFLLTPSLW